MLISKDQETNYLANLSSFQNYIFANGSANVSKYKYDSVREKSPVSYNGKKIAAVSAISFCESAEERDYLSSFPYLPLETS